MTREDNERTTMFLELKKFAIWLLGLYCMGFVLVALHYLSPYGRNDSDPGDWGARSNLAPRTDALTGCQYLATSEGGITPRLDGKGRHVGCR